MDSAVPDDNFCELNQGFAPTYSTTYLQYAHSLAQECRDTLRVPSKQEEDEEELSEGEHSAERLSSASSDNGAALTPSEYRPRTCTMFEDVKVGCAVAQFCTLNDLKAFRAVSRNTTLAANAFAQFDALSKMVFLPLPASVVADLSVSSNAAEWRCVGCGSRNASQLSRCSFDGCGTYRSSSSSTPAHGEPQRLFFGQMRKEATVACVAWLSGMLCPPSTSIHRIEAHTNGADGRGKGCAWVYAANDESQRALLKLNKRLYFDYDGGDEGVWVSSPDAQDLESLEAYAKEQLRRARHSGRPTVLPRAPVVIELPNDKGDQQRHPNGRFRQHNPPYVSPSPYYASPCPHHCPAHAYGYPPVVAHQPWLGHGNGTWSHNPYAFSGADVMGYDPFS